MSLQWPDAVSATFGWDLLDRMTTAGDGTSQAGFTYDNLGRRTQLSRTGAATTSWSYVANSRNYSLMQDLSGTANDVTYALSFKPAGQVISRDVSNSAYQFPMVAAPNTAYVPDGLNQYDSVGGTAFTHDARGNLTSDGTRTYTYDPLNRLTGITGGGASVTLAYDPLGRLKTLTDGGTASDWLWDGDRLVGEYNAGGT
ncbi:MAG: hypothetical protein HZY74_08935 [Brevundimonas sp.]|nr:MAG: hypothetical protein HZY74_08935 [Brevundimonas sp.]